MKNTHQSVYKHMNDTDIMIANIVLDTVISVLVFL